MTEKSNGADNGKLDIVRTIVSNLGMSLAVTEAEAFVKRHNVLPVFDEESGIRIDFIFSSTHIRRVAEAPTPGKQYQCLLNGMPLYEARIKDVMGCWATVEVVQPIPGPHESNYKSGQTFDIRVSSYSFQEKA